MTTELLLQKIKTSKDSGVNNLSQMYLLIRASGMGQCPKLTEVAKEIGISSAAITQTSDRLELEGLVTKTRDPGDRRVYRVALTKKGQELVNWLLGPVRAES